MNKMRKAAEEDQEKLSEEQEELERKELNKVIGPSGRFDSVIDLDDE